jgi:ornithine lipid hydroxylase
MLAACFNGVNGLLQHANVRQTTPGLDWVLATPDLHVWHHSKLPALANANYGSNVILWDVVFGTRLKHAPEPPLDVGLHYELPQTLLGQLATPFRSARTMLRGS